MLRYMDKLLALLPAKPQPRLVRYGMSTVLVALCLLLLMWVRSMGGGDAFFIMYPAIFLSAVLFDRGSGFYATGLSTMLLIVLLERQVGSVPRADWLPLVLFFLIGFALATVSEALRKGWELAIASERAKDLLYRELGHRTKNDLATAAAVLGLQARQQSNQEVKAALSAAIGRLQVLGKAHEQFEPGAGDQMVRMRNYLDSICGLLRSGAGDEISIEVENCDDIVLAGSRAIPIGLIVNELITNAFKHAFSERGTGHVVVRCEDSESLTLTVEDDGKGCPEGGAQGLGSRLIELLVNQLGGTLRREDAKPGCRVIVTVPQDEQE